MCLHKWESGMAVTVSKDAVLTRRCKKCGMIQRNDYDGKGWKVYKEGEKNGR